MDLKRIRELTDAFEASDWDEIDLEIDGVRIQLSTAAAPASHTPAPAPAPAAPADPPPAAAPPDHPNEGAVRAVSLPEGAPRSGSDAAPASPDANEGAVRAVSLPEGAPRSGTGDEHGAGPAGDGGPADVPAQVPAGADGTPVAAPSPGIFWRAPSPGEPPFVEVGDRVEADTVVCIVELMKLMNRVVAGVSGTVTAVLADNGQPVEKGGSLVLVDQG